jgi:hypothetical protein
MWKNKFHIDSASQSKKLISMLWMFSLLVLLYVDMERRDFSTEGTAVWCWTITVNPGSSLSFPVWLS